MHAGNRELAGVQVSQPDRGQREVGARAVPATRSKVVPAPGNKFMRSIDPTAQGKLKGLDDIICIILSADSPE